MYILVSERHCIFGGDKEGCKIVSRNGSVSKCSYRTLETDLALIKVLRLYNNSCFNIAIPITRITILSLCRPGKRQIHNN